MTEFKIKEKVELSSPIDKDYDFINIEIGDMFHNYEFDKTIMIVGDPVVTDNVYVLDLSEYQILTDSEIDLNLEDCLMRIRAAYGDFYPISKAKLSFTVGG